MKNPYQRFDKIVTKHGAGGFLKAGLVGIVATVNGRNLFIMVNGNGWHVKWWEVEKASEEQAYTVFLAQ